MTFGAGVLGKSLERDYELLCGLAFNMDRAELRKANRVRVGIATAFASKLPADWFKALAVDDAEGEAMFNRQRGAAVVGDEMGMDEGEEGEV